MKFDFKDPKIWLIIAAILIVIGALGKILIILGLIILVALGIWLYMQNKEKLNKHGKK